MPSAKEGFANQNSKTIDSFVTYKVKNKDEKGLDFEIDKLTNSIENVVTGDNFQTEVAEIDFIGGEGPLTKEEEQAINEYLKRKSHRNQNLGKNKQRKIRALHLHENGSTRHDTGQVLWLAE